jgi:hypothetical protein
MKWKGQVEIIYMQNNGKQPCLLNSPLLLFKAAFIATSSASSWAVDTPSRLDETSPRRARAFKLNFIPAILMMDETWLLWERDPSYNFEDLKRYFMWKTYVGTNTSRVKNDPVGFCRSWLWPLLDFTNRFVFLHVAQA